jgi:hypothetical protein
MKFPKIVVLVVLLGLAFAAHNIIDIKGVNILNNFEDETKNSEHIPLSMFYTLKEGMTKEEVEAIVGKASLLHLTGVMRESYFTIDKASNEHVEVILTYDGVLRGKEIVPILTSIVISNRPS